MAQRTTSPAGRPAARPIVRPAARRRRFALRAPRLATFAASLALVLAAALSLRFHLPVAQTFVAAHRFWLAVAGYGLLALGVLLPML